MDEVAEALKERTKAFAIAVLDFVDTLPETPVGRTIGGQLLRAGTGVVGNYRSACRGRSHAEFTARLGVVLEEADESELWLDIICTRRMGSASREALLDESRQLRAIFSKTCETARANQRRR
jgi:four helix bundle protein